MLRTVLFRGPLVGALVIFAARPALAADHAVYARAHSSAGTSQTFTFPDLSEVAEARYSLGAAGVDDAVVNNVARADVRTGTVKIASLATKQTAPGLPASNWGQVARIEQKLKPAASGGATTATVRLTASGSGKIQTTSLHVRLTGRIAIGSCSVATSQIIKSTGPDPVEAVDNCTGSPILSGIAAPGSAAIKISNLAAGVTVVAEVTATYEGSAFVGAIEAAINGALSIEDANGAVVATSPAFLAGAADGGAPDAGPPVGGSSGSSGTSSGGSGTSSGVTPTPEAGAASDDGGCSASPAHAGAQAPSALLVVAAAAALRRRARRASRASRGA